MLSNGYAKVSHHLIGIHAPQRIELGLALLSPTQKQAVSELGAMAAAGQDTANNPSTDGTNHTTEETLASTGHAHEPRASPQIQSYMQHPVNAAACRPAACRPAAAAQPETATGSQAKGGAEDRVRTSDTIKDDVDMSTDDKMVP